MNPIAAYTSALGQAMAEFCGMRITRATQAAAVGATTLPLERVAGLPSPGIVFVGGNVYRYDSIVGNVLQNVGIMSGGVRVPGLLAAVAVGDAVIDQSRTYSAIDGLRSDIFLDTANGTDLTALGNNVGIPRNPNVPSDTQYRALIETLAYSRRHTVQGIIAALNVLIGPNNFTFSEDLISNPLTVFIGLKRSALITNAALGQGFLSGRTAAVPTNNGFAVPAGTLRVSSIVLTDEDVFTDCTTAGPETAGQGWAYVGPAASETHETGTGGTSATQLSGSSAAYFAHPASLLPQTDAMVSAQFGIVTGGSDARQAGIEVNDGARFVAAGVSISGGSVNIGFIGPTGSFVAGSVSYPLAAFAASFHTILIKKRGTTYASLYVDGVLVETLSYTTFPAGLTAGLQIGILASTGTPCTLLLQNLALSTRNHGQDFWNATGADASATANSQTVTCPSAAFVAGDVGKRFRITASAALNPQGGSNQGTYVIAAVVDASDVTLSCPITGTVQVGANAPSFASGSLGNNQAIEVVGNAQAFHYPYDLGRIVTITGSRIATNNGDFVISDLIEPNSGYSMIPQPGAGAHFNTSLPGTTNVAVVTPLGGGTANFVSDTGLAITMRPSFATDSGMSWELSDAGTLTKGVATPRQALPLPNATYQLLCNIVLSAQVQADHLVHNTGANSDGSYDAPFWPLYASDQGSFIRDYLNDLTAAGVVVNMSTY